MAKKKISDEEIVESIQEALEDDGRVRTDYMTIESHDGKPVLGGRLGSDEELQVVEEILTDVLEFDRYENHLWVDDTLAFDGSDDDGDADASLDMDEDEGDEDPFDEDGGDDEE